MKELTVREIIEYAIKIEKESFAFYTRAAENIAQPEVQKLLEQLAREEVGHQNYLRALIDEEKVIVDELQKTLNIDTTLMDRVISTAGILPAAGPLEVLNVALEREKNTEQTYAMLLTFSQIDANVVEIFQQLREQEAGHARKIIHRIEMINQK